MQKSSPEANFYRGFHLWKTGGKPLGKNGGETPEKDPPGEIRGEIRGEIPVETFSGCRIIPLWKTPRKTVGKSLGKGIPFLLCKTPEEIRGEDTL